MIKSISTQTGDFSYSLNLEFTGYGPFEFGWSGDLKIFSFSGQSGNLYDNSSRLFYSYGKGESLNISGNRVNDYNNYFVNDILFNSNNSQNTGYVESFFSSGPVSPQITFKGNQPNYSVNSGVIKNGGTTGIVNVSNNGAEEFKFYSGNFLGASGDLFSFGYPFDSGSITSFKNFGFNFSSSDGTTGRHPVTAEFYTNFGIITKTFNIFSIYDLEALFSLDGPSFINTTGNYDYRLDYDLTFGTEKSTDPYFLQLELRNISGLGDVLTPILFTGYPTSGSIDLVASGYINESGTLTSSFITEVSGFNTGLQYDTTGLHTGTLNSGFQWATGDFLKTVSIPATGQATGNLTGRFDISGKYDFSNTGLVNFTGQATGYLDTITGLTFSGNWDSYDNRAVESINTVLLTSSGIEPPYASASSPDVEYNFAFTITGRATGKFKDSVTLYKEDLQTRVVQFGYTGNVYDENPIVTGEAVFTDVSGLVNGIGETITGYGNYTGFASGITGNVVLDIQNQTNILSNYTGSITGVADFNFIAWTQFSSGEIEGSFPITTLGRYELTGQKTSLTGNYYTKIQTTATNYDNYELNFIDSQNLTGYSYFTGDYTFSGTGFYVGDCSGVGYTGAGIVGFIGEENVRITEDMTGFFRDPQITDNFNFCLPLSGSRWFDNPLEISGNSGIALCYSHSDRVAETLNFSANDSLRGDYTLNPFVLTYKWMDGATTFNDNVTFKFSPYYYASGTGVYEYKDGNTLSAAITFYSGEFPLLDYKEIETFSFANQGWSENFNNYTENPFTFNQNTGDWKILITINDGENVPPSGFFYMFWYDDSDNTQNNSPKVFNSYIGGESYNNNFKSSSQAEIYLNNSYPLDEVEGAKAAFSYKKLSSSYTGYCLDVERLSDGLTTGIKFSGNFVDLSSLESFCAGTDGYLSGWYDQTENGHNITGDGSKPLLVSNGVFQTGAIFNNNALYTSGNFGLTKDDPITTIFTADISTFETHGTMWAQNWSDFNDSFSVGVHANLGNKLATDQWNPRGSAASGDPVLLDTNYTFAVHTPVIEQHLTGGASFWINGTGFEGSGYEGSVANNLADAPLAVGGFGTLGNGHWNGRIQEIIIYDSDVSGQIPLLSSGQSYSWNTFPLGIDEIFRGFVPSIESGRPTGIMSHLKVLNNETNFISREGPENLQLLLTGTGYTSDVDVSGRRVYDLTGEFIGTSRSGFYFSEITGFQNGYVNTGLLDDGIFYYNYITGFRIGQLPTSLTAQNLFTGRVHAGYTVEQFSGDLADKVTGFGFDLFLDGTILNVSGDPASSTVFGFGLNSSSLSSSYNTYQNDFNTIGQVGVSATGISSKELEFPTFIQANGIDGTFSGNAFNFSSSLDMTGSFTATGNNTGLASTSIPEGYNQTGISGSYFAPFSGFTGNINVPSRNIFETLYNWTALTGENWTGFQNRAIYNTGNALSTGYYTGQVFSGNINVPFTGQISGVTTITGVDITILDGSGTFDLTGIVTGRYSSLAGFDFGFFDKITDGVFIEQPSGSFSGVLTGTGYYEKEIVYNFQDTPFTYFSPSYIKTFTGEYEFYTGVSTGNLVEILYDTSDNIFKSGIYITGENTIFARIVNKKFFENDRDIIELFYSGESPKTGGVII